MEFVKISGVVKGRKFVVEVVVGIYWWKGQVIVVVA